MTCFITDHDYLTSAAASVRTQEINTGSRFMIDDNLYESGATLQHSAGQGTLASTAAPVNLSPLQ